MVESELIISNRDISPILSPRDVEFLDRVDEVILQSIAQSNPTHAFDFGRSLWKDGHLKGLALAKFLAKMNQQWHIFQNGEVSERFEDAVSSEIGISPQTARKYADMWENIFENGDIPEDVRRLLYGKPIKSLILLNAAARDNEIDDWQKVADATTGSEIRDLVRSARGEQTSSKSAIRIVVSRDGDIKVYRGGDSKEVVAIGHLNLSLMSDPDVKKAITRIIDRGGLLWQ